MLIWIKQRLIWFTLQRDGTRNGLSNIKETSAENLQLKISVLYTKVWAFWPLKLIWRLGKKNVKKKYLMCHIPIKMFKQHATPNSSLNNLKIYSSKRLRKTSQRWIYVATYLANTAVSSKYSNFQQKISLQTIGFSFHYWIVHLLLTLTSLTQFWGSSED